MNRRRTNSIRNLLDDQSFWRDPLKSIVSESTNAEIQWKKVNHFYCPPILSFVLFEGELILLFRVSYSMIWTNFADLLRDKFCSSHAFIYFYLIREKIGVSSFVSWWTRCRLEHWKHVFQVKLFAEDEEKERLFDVRLSSFFLFLLLTIFHLK